MNLGPVAENLGINWKMFLAQVINFGIVFLVLKKFAFGPIQRVLEERKQKAAKGIEDAQKAETALMMAETQQKEKIEKARIEANKIIAEAQKTREGILQKTKEESQKEAKKIVEQAKAAAQEEQQKMLAKAQGEMVELTFLATEKLLGKETDKEDNRRFVQNLIENKK